MEQKCRKRIRLPASAYEAGWFFVTICTEKREKLLSQVRPFVGADDSVRPCAAFETRELILTPMGEMVKECLELLADEDMGVMVDRYVIMPNHIHAIFYLDGEKGGQSRPPLQRLVQRFKSVTTRRSWKMGRSTLWQRSFYDRVLRGEEEYLRVCEYITNNPARWTEDEYYYPE